MEDWSNEMKDKEHALQEVTASAPQLPTIRSNKNSKLSSSQSDKQAGGTLKPKSSAPRDYSEWDKFDVDKEILRMELEDERRREQLAKKKKQQEREKKKMKNEEENSPITAANNLSSVEKEFMAKQQKDKGNEYYCAGDYEQAVKCYSNSIVLCPTPTAYNNRAMAQLKLQKYSSVIADCNQVLEAEPLNVKALHRRGIAYQNQNCFEQAYEDFSKILELEPGNESARSLAEQTRKKLEPAVKSVRLTIEEEYSEEKGFVIPRSRSDVPMNEWGLAKVMCRCSGTPAWVHMKPPKCKICQKKRAERRAKREEEARRADDGDQMQIDDEKGTGDTKDIEKIVESCEEGAKFPKIVDNYELEEQCKSGDNKMNNIADFTTQLINSAKDTTYSSNFINSCGSNNKEDEKQKASVSNNQRKRAERRNKREEEEKVATDMEQEIVNDSNEAVVTFYGEGEQMQTDDEKGSGDMKDIEKIVETCEDGAKFPKIVDNYVLEEQCKSEDSRINDVADISAQSVNNPEDATYNCNFINSCDNNEQDESYQIASASNDFKNPKDKLEKNKSKTNVDSDKKVVGSDDTRKSQRETKQKSPVGSDSSSGKHTKVNIASKYKKNVPVMKNDAPEAFQQADIEVTNITTPFEFVKAWQSLKVSSDLAAHAQVLQSVSPSDLPSLVGNKLDGPMLSTMLLCLEKHFNPELALEYLNSIIQLPRFNIVQMFLEVAEKQAICKLLEKMESMGHHPSSAIWNAFTC